MSSDGTPGMARRLDTTSMAGLTTACFGRPPPPGLEDRQHLPFGGRDRVALGSRSTLPNPKARGAACVVLRWRRARTGGGEATA
jgi:hypothetical protein